jgi:putative sigma-54 modulation protein
MELSDDLRESAVDKVSHAGRIFDDGQYADVEFIRAPNPRAADGRYQVEITTLAAGHTVRVEATAQDDRAALDLAQDKFERQLRKLKERLIQRSRQPKNKHLNSVPEPSDEHSQDMPQIVRIKRFDMRPMTPEEAALQMEMIGHDFFFFLNAESGDNCVLYHRLDGQLGLIEPQ